MSDKKERSKSISFTSSNVDWEEDVKENVEGVELIEDESEDKDEVDPKFFHVTLSEEVHEINEHTYYKMMKDDKTVEDQGYIFGINRYVLDNNRKHRSKLIYIAEQHAKKMFEVE